MRAAAGRTLSLSASMSLDFAGSFAAPIPGNGFFDFATGAGRARIEQPVGTETAVFLPKAVFDRPPAQNAAGLPRGKTWIMAEPAEHIRNAASFSQFVLQIEGKSPIFLLAEVAWGAAWAAPLRPETVGGAPANGFAVGIDLASAASGASGPAGAALSSAIADEERAASAAPTIRVWIDTAGRVVQLQASPPGSGVGTTTMTVTAFGARVDATRPPRRETIDLASLAPGGDYDRD